MSTNAADAAAQAQAASSGLALHNDRYLGFSLMYPSAWHQFQWLDGRRGVLYGPVFNDNSTIFAVAIQDLGIVVNQRDVKDLHVGFIAGIGRLDESRIETQRQWQSGVQIGMEARYTFREGEIVRKRWVRVFYQDTRQLTITAQAATQDEFAHWLSTFQTAMNNFRIYAKPQYKEPRPTPAPEALTRDNAQPAEDAPSTQDIESTE
ncbi:hypothetical protein GC175_13480 [bacterium]|nr:hypothetical protein [bacterium]